MDNINITSSSSSINTRIDVEQAGQIAMARWAFLYDGGLATTSYI